MPSLDFSLPGAGCGLHWTCSMPGSLPKGLDLIGAIQNPPTPPPPHPSVSHAFPLHLDCWINGAGRLYGPAAPLLLLLCVRYRAPVLERLPHLGAYNQGSIKYFGCKNYCIRRRKALRLIIW